MREALVQMVKERIPCIKISQVTVTKNNGQTKEGFQAVVRENPDRSSISICIYMDDLIAACGEDASMEELADRITEIIKDNRDVPFDGYPKWEEVKDQVFVKLVNRKKNRNDLIWKPHSCFLDLAKAYYINMPASGEKDAWSADITYTMLDQWGVDVIDLDMQAEENMKQVVFDIKPIWEVVKHYLPDDREGTDFPKPRTFVVTKRDSKYGAAIMAQPDSMKKLLQEIGSDCYVIPSSVHDIMLHPCDEPGSIEELNTMVREVNESIDPTEVLSDHVYRYCMESGEIKY